MPADVRLGLIGAGGFTTNRHLPAFQAIPGVSVTLIANRRRESAESVADRFGIAAVADDYREVVASDQVDAVLIGTPPYLHLEAARAALAAGKHVFCQTRISTTAAEAREMQRLAEEAAGRGVRAMLSPPAPYYRGSAYVAHLIGSGYLGQLRHVLSFNMNASFADPARPLSAGRNDADLYGRYNAMQLGLSYDVMARWTGYATSVIAQRATFVAERPVTAGGPVARNPFPDEITVIADTTSGAIASNLVNYSVHHSDPRIELYGSEGTLIYRQRGDLILGGRAGEKELQPLAIPAEHDQPWQVEAEFIALARGEREQASFTFWHGVQNMEYLEAAYRAAVEGRRVAVMM